MHEYSKPVPSLDWPHPGAELVYEFVVLGQPKPAGSKTPGVVTRSTKDGRRVPVFKPNGMPIMTVRDSSGADGKAWRQEVGSTALTVRSTELLDCPLVFEVVFFRPRPASHYGTGRNAGVLKASAPLYPSKRPDALKLARAVEDALTSVLWTDDARIVDERQRKEFGSPERAEVRVWRLPETVGEVATVTAEQGSLLDP